ncbi:MAG: phosphoribosyltransferase family protein [Nitrospirota bacterium]
MSSEQEQAIRHLLDIFKNHVLLKINDNIVPYFSDELDDCFALDYNLEELPGTTITEYTRYGRLEHAAKENQDTEARAELVAILANLCEIHPIYREAGTIMPVPPNPSKRFHLPVELARELSRRTSKRDGTTLIRKVKDTPKLQSLSLDEKLEVLRGAIEITGDVNGRSIILIDDLYQSGSTMWTVAKLLKKNGARRVLGLACVKSWRDTDNK